jgi:phospholipid/cholesterol/gamma-HCH transport system substrate-binding protein
VNTRIPRYGIPALVAFAAATTVVFLVLAARFGGPTLRLHAPYRVHVSVRDAQGIAPRADVVVRGVRVGSVAGVARHGRATDLTLELHGVDVHRDASVRIDLKTLLGEAEVRLDPGRRGVASLPSGGTIARVIPTVTVDEALGALDAPSRAHLRSLLLTGARGAADPQASLQLSNALAGVHDAAEQLRTLTATLRAQSAPLAATVRDTDSVLAGLQGSEGAIRAIVASGRTTLGAIASRSGSLDAALRELPGLMTVARRTLTDARPLIGEARPVIAAVRAAAPTLAPALRALPPVTRDAEAILARSRPLRAATLPFLRHVRPLLGSATPVLGRLEPALANVIPMLRYFAPRWNTIAAWFTNTADLGSHGDAKGAWARFFLFLEPGSALGLPGTTPHNAYTGSGDAASNQPYRRGDYPRLTPYAPR